MTANTKMMTVKEQNKALNKTDVSGSLFSEMNTEIAMYRAIQNLADTN